MATGTLMAASQNFKSAYPLSIGSFKVTMYSAFLAILANLIVTIVLTPLTRRLDPRPARDETRPADYADDVAAGSDGELIPA
jgi:solute:Na+ symporter, SSS family